MPVINTGTESNGISAHGTIIKRNSENIAEVKDITLPALTRKPIDTSTHNSDDDSYVMGIRRKGELQFMVNWLATDEPTHDATDGLLQIGPAGFHAFGRSRLREGVALADFGCDDLG